MTETEAKEVAKNLALAGFDRVEIIQKPDGTWTAIGVDSVFRPGIIAPLGIKTN